MPVTHKGRRRYDATERKARAARRRDDVLTRARELFLAQGYAATTIAMIAREAEVSAETIYKTFGGKAGIVTAIYERSLFGSAPTAAEIRSDAAQRAASDARALFVQFGEFSAEIAPLTAPMMRLIRDAAAGGDTEMTKLLRDTERMRYERMRHNAETLKRRGFLRAGLDASYAADVMWTYTADDVFSNLVVARTWSLPAYARFISDSLCAALL
jgi:AcrR family transcriptional regulator